MNRKAQVTIFIILGIVIVAGVLAFIFLKDGIRTSIPSDENPRQFIIDCVEETVEDALFLVMENGGEISPRLYVEYFGEIYNYLCYSGDFFRACYNLHPMLQYRIETEVFEDTKEDVESCFESLTIDIQKKGYDVSTGAIDYSVDLLPGVVRINLMKELMISKEETLKNFENFNMEVLYPSYDLVQVTNDIINDEAVKCKFDHYDYMRANSRFHIEKDNFQNNTLYELTERRSGLTFKFAVRNCVLPYGL